MHAKQARKLESAILDTLTRGELERLKNETRLRIAKLDTMISGCQARRDSQTKFMALIKRAINMKGKSE